MMYFARKFFRDSHFASIPVLDSQTICGYMYICVCVNICREGSYGRRRLMREYVF